MTNQTDRKIDEFGKALCRVLGSHPKLARPSMYRRAYATAGGVSMAKMVKDGIVPEDHGIGSGLRASVPVRSHVLLYKEPKYGDLILVISNRFRQHKTVLLDFANDATLEIVMREMCMANRRLHGCCTESTLVSGQGG